MKIYQKKKPLLVRVTIEESNGAGFYSKESITLEETTFDEVVQAVVLSYNMVSVYTGENTAKVQVREYTDKNGISRSFTFERIEGFKEMFLKNLFKYFVCGKEH